MNPTDSTESRPSFLGAKAASVLAAVLLAGIAVVVALATSDRAHVTHLEGFEQTTAVGDHALFRVPSPSPNPPQSVATLDGKTLTPISYEKVKIDDTNMRRVGRDATTGLTIYTPRELKERKGQLFVKIDVGEFLRVE